VAGNSADTGRSVTNKVVAILLTFTNGTTYSLTELARLTHLPISTAHRLAGELTAWGLLERTDSGRYRTGEQLRIIGGRAGSASGSLHERSRRVMEDLSLVVSRSTVRLGVLHGGRVTYVEKTAGPRPVGLFLDAGTAPAHASAMGKALLAFSSPRVLEAVVHRGLETFTPYTLTNGNRLRRTLGVTRLTRVAVSRGEWEMEHLAVAAPIFGAGGDIAAALELDVREARDLRSLQAPLVVAARSLSRDLAETHCRGHFLLTAEPHYRACSSCDPISMPGAGADRG
jgi:DNA-binding IclR family transcriptional regulator